MTDFTVTTGLDGLSDIATCVSECGKASAVFGQRWATIGRGVLQLQQQVPSGKFCISNSTGSGCV